MPHEKIAVGMNIRVNPASANWETKFNKRYTVASKPGITGVQIQERGGLTKSILTVPTSPRQCQPSTTDGATSCVNYQEFNCNLRNI